MVLVCAAVLAFLPPQAAPSQEVGFGLNTTTFSTPKGKIKVYLPYDMSAKDTITGTVVAEPEGKNEKERASASAELSGYVVDIAGQSTSAKDRYLKFVVPAALGAGMRLILKDAKGNTVSGVTIPPFNPNGPEPFRPPMKDPPPNVPSGPGPFGNPNGPEPYRLHSPNSSGFQLPQITQSGVIHGTFNGDVQNTNVSIGGKDTTVLAESHGTVVCEGPAGPAGDVAVEVKEGDKTATGQVRNLKLDLTAPTTTLLNGQKTEVKAQVTGLGGLPASFFPIPFHLENQSPRTVQFDGVPGQKISHWIQQSDVSSAGTYQYTAGVIGVTPGAFLIRAGIFFWPWSSKPTPPDYLDAFGRTPDTSPWKVCAYLITVGPGKGAADVAHSAVMINGTVYSFEGNGMNAYTNAGAYINKRREIDGREVTVNPLSDMNKDAMLAEIAKASYDKYHLTKNNCAIMAGRIIKAGLKGETTALLPESHPLRLRDRNEDTGLFDKGKRVEIKDHQIDK